MSGQGYVGQLEAERDRYREALEAIDQGSWGTLLRARYGGVRMGPSRVVVVPEEAEIRRLARAALCDETAHATGTEG